MDLVWEGLREAFDLLVRNDEDVYEIAWRSIAVSGTATLISLVLGVLTGAALAFKRFPGRIVVMSLVNTGMGMPPIFLQSAQVECPAAPFEEVEVHFGHAIASSGFAWAVPVRRGAASFARIGLMSDTNAGRQFEAFVSRVGARLGLATGGDGRMEPRQKMLPLAPIPATYADRIVAVGDAAGLVKATTGGGIYYSLVSASLAADVLEDGLRRDGLDAARLEPYQDAWRKRLGPELDAQLSLRLLANRLTDDEIEMLFDLAQTDGIMPIVRRTARFNRHRDLIVSLLKHPPARRVLFRRLAGRQTVTR